MLNRIVAVQGSDTTKYHSINVAKFITNVPDLNHINPVQITFTPSLFIVVTCV
jgi:hypothetical protein